MLNRNKDSFFNKQELLWTEMIEMANQLEVLTRQIKESSLVINNSLRQFGELVEVINSNRVLQERIDICLKEKMSAVTH